ncbi:hypothetical protein KSS87_012426 [Heliosperma pusillum]|nr:hypothetical protein KSS87_012426 [Heliosperma pusillum]
MAEAILLDVATNSAMAVGQLIMARGVDEMKLAWGLKDELEKLKTKFSELQPFLQDVANAKHADKRIQVNDWLQKVKDAAYFADDIMDDYAYEILRRELEQNKKFKKQFRAFFTRHNPIIFRIKMSHKVRDAIAMFDELDSKAQSIGLKQVDMTRDGMTGTWADNNDGSINLSQARQHAAADATEFVGRTEDEEQLLEMLCHPSNQERQISAIAIVGLGDGAIQVRSNVDPTFDSLVGSGRSGGDHYGSSLLENPYIPYQCMDSYLSSTGLDSASMEMEHLTTHLHRPRTTRSPQNEWGDGRIVPFEPFFHAFPEGPGDWIVSSCSQMFPT